MQTHLFTVKIRLEINENMKMTFICYDRVLFINQNDIKTTIQNE
jgi:hypothetical protein